MILCRIGPEATALVALVIWRKAEITKKSSDGVQKGGISWKLLGLWGKNGSWEGKQEMKYIFHCRDV